MARDRHRVRRDAAGVGPDPDLVGRLYRLGEADYRIVDGEPDIRGWEVRTLAGNVVGAVHDLLIDPDRGEVVMLEIDLKDTEQEINIPIRGVQLDRSRRRVVVDSGDVRRARESYMGDVESDVRARGDLRVQDARAADARGVEEGTRGERPEEEVVVERRPFVEEVVVRRRPTVGESGAEPPEEPERDRPDEER